MAVIFVTFLERSSPTRVKLQVIMWDKTIELFVDKNRTQHLNSTYYSTDEWESIDFESLNEHLCYINGYIGNDTAFVFELPREDEVNINDIVLQYIKENYPGKSKYGSIFMNRLISEQWFHICKRYDTNLEKVITEATTRKIGINIQKTDLIIERINAVIDSNVDDHLTSEHLKDDIRNILDGCR